MKGEELNNHVSELRNYIGKDGNIAFEHGYVYPKINLHGDVVNVTMVGYDTLVGYKVVKNDKKVVVEHPVKDLTPLCAKSLLIAIKIYVATVMGNEK